MMRDFKKDFSSLDQIFAFVDEHLSAPGIGPDTRNSVHFIVEELFTNMVKYGTSSRLDVTLAVRVEASKLTIELTDHDVEEFDPNSAPEIDPSVPLQQRRIGGLGIHLVKQMVDELRYSYADRCSTITVVKNLGK